MVFSLALSNITIASAEDTDRQTLEIEELDGSDYDLDLVNVDVADSAYTLDETLVDASEAVQVLVVLEDESIIEADSSAVLDETTQARSDELEEQQAQVIADIEETVLEGESLEVSYNYTWLVNGFSATVPYGTIDEIRALDGVKQVLLEPMYQVCEDETDSYAQLSDQIMTVSDGEMIGRESTWMAGYTGAGTKIAIIDTGIDATHQNFQALSEDKLTDTSATPETVAAVLSSLNASSMYEGLTVDDVYYSTKIAFGFNYADSSLNIGHKEDSQGDHGTHVAGIAAANQVEEGGVVGVAPDAQLYVMKVFGSGTSGASSASILAALEDALILGADVINMSLGTPCGFTSDGDYFDSIYSRVSTTGAILAISAGNSGVMGEGNAWGTEANLTSNVDNSTMSSPAAYMNVLSVASMENAYYMSDYVQLGGYNIAYTDGSGSQDALSTLAGQSFEVVVVPGLGEASDYEGLDLTGKIALVKRGVIAFTEKAQNAQDAGAVACLIYNNTTGTLGLDLSSGTATIPCVALSMVDGNYLISALESDATQKITIGDGTALVASSAAGQMSSFSSWGVSPDLSLEPDITAPGGNIYSTLDGGEYGLMSGTSMASPNVAGISALVVQYVKQQTSLTGEELHTFVKSLLMSTSVPQSYDDELYYSPRNQGSGLANAYGAVTTEAYLTVAGVDTPKAELGDDPDRTGSYSFDFDVTNFGERDLFYALNTVAQTEGVDEVDGNYFMSSTPVALAADTAEDSASTVLTYDVDDNDATNSHDAYIIYRAAVAGNGDEDWTDVSFRYNTDKNETVDSEDVQAYLEALVGNDSPADLTEEVLKVSAGETATVSVSVDLADADKTYFETYYENGCYVEGFTFLTALNTTGTDLSLPYLAFFGDWTDAPILDTGFYWEEEPVYSQYLNGLYSQYTYYGSIYGLQLGINPYVTDEAINPAHLSLSPDDNGYGDSIEDIYLSLLRNVATLTFRYTDADTGVVYHEETIENARKSYYSDSYAQVVPYIYSWDSEGYDMIDPATGEYLTNNTNLVLTIEGCLDYDTAETETLWEVPIKVDVEAPQLLGAELVQNGDQKTLELTFKDNVAVSAVMLLDTAGTTIYGTYAVEDVTPDADGYQNYTASYDVTGLTGKLMIIVGDYAYNEGYYGINLNGAGNTYGDMVAFQYDAYGSDGTWVSFNSDVAQNEVAMFTSSIDMACAEYVNGFVFAQGKDGKLYGFPYEDMLQDGLNLESTYIATLENVYQDLAYNYVDGNLYGMRTYEERGTSCTEVDTINLNGRYFDSGMWTWVEAYEENWALSRGNLSGLTMAIDDEGSVYVLGTVTDEDTGEESTAQLWKADLVEDWGSVYLDYFYKVGDTGLDMNYLQSMTWDHNSEKLYWARFYPVTLFNLESQLIELDPETGKATQVGTLSNETGCFFVPLTEESAALDAHSNVPEFDRETVGVPSLNKNALTLNVSGSETLICSFDPWYSRYTDVTWTSSDESVATVSADGTVTGVASGSCTITVTSVKDPTLTDTCTVTVAALELNIQGITSVTTGGLYSLTGSYQYDLTMVNGATTITMGNAITAPSELNYGLDLSAATLAKGSIWACEWGNTGMIYQINATSGAVEDVLEPIDGGVLYGLTYSENTGMFTGIMNYYVFVDMPMTHDQEKEITDSYDETLNDFTWHRFNLADCLSASDENFGTGESNGGSISEIVLCGITTLDRAYTYTNTYKDYLGKWDYSNEVNYTSTVTYVMLDNVGRLWYMDEITGLTKDDYGYYSNSSSYLSGDRNGMFILDNGDGTYNAFYLRAIEETPLTDMYRSGTMIRFSYTFSDLYYAGQAEDGTDMFFMSLYDYWNGAVANEFYLYLPGSETLDYETWEYVTIDDRLYDLGSAGNGNIITTITSAKVTGGLSGDAEDEAVTETESVVNPLATDSFRG
jgi:subtilisin family serine protease